MNNPNVDAVVTSVTDTEQLEQNVRAVGEPFTDAERQLLTVALERFGPDYCRLCGRCNGTCAQGLPIPEILRCRMYAQSYGQFALGRDKFLGLPPELRGGACRECQGCSVRCAYGLKVAEKVRQTNALLA
jgi:predicted aldo/keto reductase-like oxidoreductase